MRAINATSNGAIIIEIQKPNGPGISFVILKVAKAPIMYKDPCATFGTRRTPKTKLSPAQTTNKIIARLKPTKNWLMKAEKSTIRNPQCS